jgi:hypothetical protein
MSCGPHAAMVLADDRRHDAMGFPGHPFAKTPAMDSIGFTAGRLSQGNQRKIGQFSPISPYFPASGILPWQFFGRGRK